MKAKLFFLAFVFLYTISFSQDIIIDFSGNGASNTIDNVIIENLSNGSTVTVPGDKAFNLTTGTVGIIETNSNYFNKIKTFPNPTYSNTNIIFNLIKTELINIVIFDINGKNIINQSKKLYKGLNKIIFTPSKKGIYFISISGKDFSKTTKIINLNSNNLSSEIKFENISSTFAETKNKDNYDFSFTVGDIIKLTATSGIYSTVIADAPTISKTYTFELIQCRDYENNNYPIVQIGSQIWMAKNLASLKYSNGDNIPNVYALNNNDNGEANTFGYLYTWDATMNGSASSYENPSGIQGICPTGWHVPSSPEWGELAESLGGYDFAGAELKSVGTSLWSSPNNGTNSSGFTALPGSFRRNDGSFGTEGETGYWWISNSSEGNAAIRHIRYNESYLGTGTFYNEAGISVRCVKD